MSSGLKNFMESMAWEFAGVFFPIEPLFLDDQNWNAILEQGDPRVMGFGDDPKDLQSDFFTSPTELRRLLRSQN